MTKDFYIHIALVATYIAILLAVILSNRFPYSFKINSFVAFVIFIVLLLILYAINVIYTKIVKAIKNFMK